MRILIIGDSQAAGPPGRTLQERLQGEGHIVERIGHVGHGAYDWTRMHWREFEGAMRAMQPDHLIMIFGGNDPPDDRLAAAFRQFQAAGGPNTWYAGPPRYDARPDLQERSRRIRDLAKGVFGKKHLDAWPHSGPDVPRAGDNVHFGRTGGRVWGEGMLRDWVDALRSGNGRGGLPIWVGPVILGGAGAIALGLFLLGRRR